MLLIVASFPHQKEWLDPGNQLLDKQELGFGVDTLLERTVIGLGLRHDLCLLLIRCHRQRDEGADRETAMQGSPFFSLLASVVLSGRENPAVASETILIAGPHLVDCT